MALFWARILLVLLLRAFRSLLFHLITPKKYLKTPPPPVHHTCALAFFPAFSIDPHIFLILPMYSFSTLLFVFLWLALSSWSTPRYL